MGAPGYRPRIIKLSDIVLVILKSESYRHGYVNAAHVFQEPCETRDLVGDDLEGLRPDWKAASRARSLSSSSFLGQAVQSM